MPGKNLTNYYLLPTTGRATVFVSRKISIMLHTVLIHQCLKSSKQNTYRLIHMQTRLTGEKETVFSYRFSFCKIDATVWVDNTYQTLSWPVTACVTFVTFHKYIIYCATKKARDQRKTNESLQFH